MENEAAITPEQILNAITELMLKLSNSNAKLKIDPSIGEDIKKLNALNSTMKNRWGEKESSKTDVSKEKIQAIIDSPAIDTQTKQFFKQSEDIKKDISAIQTILSQIKTDRRKIKAESTTSNSKNSNKQQIKERRKLFKQIGGDKTWIPL